MKRPVTLSVRIVGLLAFVVVCFLCMSAWFFSEYRAGLYAEKQEATRKTVEIAYSVVDFFAAQTRGGGGVTPITVDEAKRRAIATIKHLRYDKDNYVWINDLEPRMVMHPFKPELDGTDLSGNADPTGKKLFVEMAAICRAKGEGPVPGPSPTMTNPSRSCRT